MKTKTITAVSVSLPCIALLLVELISLFHWQGPFSLFAIEAARTVSLTILVIAAIDIMLMAVTKKRRQLSQE